MKSIVIFALLVIIATAFPAAAKAQNNDYQFTLGTQAGVLWGTSYEIVYANSKATNYLSELQWQIRPLWYGGLTAAYARTEPFARSGFFAELGVKAGLPVQTGIMEDRDWFPKADPPGALTHFSSHENRTRFALLADLRAGYSFPLSGIFSLKLSLDPSYMFFKFEAWNGYIQYGPNSTKSTSDYCVPWNRDWYKSEVRGMGISLEQHWFILSPRSELVMKLDRFTVSAMLALSPLTLCYTVDNHALRNLIVKDVMMWGLFIEPKMSVLFALNKAISLGIEAGYRYIDGARGNSRATENGIEGRWLKNVAGAGYQVFEGAVILRWAL